MKKKILSVWIFAFVLVGLAFLSATMENESHVAVDSVNVNIERSEVGEVSPIEVIHKQRLEGFDCNIYVFHDNERNVTCWKISGGLSCISDHLLEERRED
jgi:hypothetical protein